MKCFECGSTRFSIANGSRKFCRKCGAVLPMIWRKTDCLRGGS